MEWVPNQGRNTSGTTVRVVGADLLVTVKRPGYAIWRVCQVDMVVIEGSFFSFLRILGLYESGSSRITYDNNCPTARIKSRQIIVLLLSGARWGVGALVP